MTGSPVFNDPAGNEVAAAVLQHLLHFQMKKMVNRNLCWNRALTNSVDVPLQKCVHICFVFHEGWIHHKMCWGKEEAPLLCFWQHNGSGVSLKVAGGNLCGTLFGSRNCRFYEKGRRPWLPELAQHTRKWRSVHYLLSHNTQEPLCAARETLAS